MSPTPLPRHSGRSTPYASTDANPSDRRTVAWASATKPVTCTALAILWQRGLLDLDDPVHQYLPEFTGKDAVTIKHLLTHTAGLTTALTDPAHNLVAAVYWNGAATPVIHGQRVPRLLNALYSDLFDCRDEDELESRAIRRIPYFVNREPGPDE